MNDKSSLVTGDYICNKFNINPIMLADACKHRKINAYSANTKRIILPSNFCNTEFKFKKSPTHFFINYGNNNLTLAIRDTCADFFDILIDKSSIKNLISKRSYEIINIQITKDDDFNKILSFYTNDDGIQIENNIRICTIEYKDKKYILYYIHLDLPLKNKFFNASRYTFTLLGNKNDYMFEYLYISENKGTIQINPVSIGITCEDVMSSNESRKCVKNCDFSKIFFISKYRILESCGITTDNRRKINDIKYMNLVNKYSILKQQRELIYRTHKDGRVLIEGKDFFKFNFKDFRYSNPLVPTTELLENFCCSIRNMLFKTTEINKLLVQNAKDNAKDKIIKNPINYILDKINQQLKIGNLSDKDKEILMIYKLKSEGKTNAEVYSIIHNTQKDVGEEQRSYVTKKKKKYPEVFSRLGIPYVEPEKISKNQLSQKDIESIIRQADELFDKITMTN